MSVLNDKLFVHLAARFQALTYFDKMQEQDLVQTIERGNVLVDGTGAVLAWCPFLEDAGFSPDDCLKLGEVCNFPEGRELLATTGPLTGPWARGIAYVAIAPEDIMQIRAQFGTGLTGSIETIAWQVRAQKARMLAYVEENRVMHYAEDPGEFGPVLQKWQLTQAPLDS